MKDAEFVRMVDAIAEIEATYNPVHGPAYLQEFFYGPLEASLGRTVAQIREQCAAASAARLTKERRSRAAAILRALPEKAASGAVDAVLKDVRAVEGLLAQPGAGMSPRGSTRVSDLLAELDGTLERWRGKEFIGIPQRRLPRLDRATRGLRGLILIAGAPNSGKTILAVQLGIDALIENPDSCLVIVSIEMSSQELLLRELSREAQLDWATVVFGSDRARGRGGETTFTASEMAALTKARARMADWAKRAAILDADNCPEPTAALVIDKVNELKAATGARRAIVVIDYLQILPIPTEREQGIRSELAEDKFRINEVKKIRDAFPGDPVICISEARKPDTKSGKSWGSGLDDLMGSARIAYRADMVIVIQPLGEEQITEATWAATYVSVADRDKTLEAMAKQGIAFSYIAIRKGRDGVLREEILAALHYRQSRIEQVDVDRGRA